MGWHPVSRPLSGLMNLMGLCCEDCLGCFSLVLPPGLAIQLKESKGKELAKISPEDNSVILLLGTLPICIEPNRQLGV